MEDPKNCSHYKLKGERNEKCPDCGDFVDFREYWDDANNRQSFRFNENGEMVEVYRRSSWVKEHFDYATATQGTYEK